MLGDTYLNICLGALESNVRALANIAEVSSDAQLYADERILFRVQRASQQSSDLYRTFRQSMKAAKST
ncbi:MAG: hypothetical protein MHM6MM_003934 [Cercozoa sp. M6MM]